MSTADHLAAPLDPAYFNQVQDVVIATRKAMRAAMELDRRIEQLNEAVAALGIVAYGENPDLSETIADVMAIADELTEIQNYRED